ncbi:MAG: transposase, partial [Gammaproteobacteria bacterium]|nr:transposase [Gammaproteobacteria bacterium]
GGCGVWGFSVAEEPELEKRCREFSADRGYDQEGLKKELWERHGVRPLIDTRLMWQDEKREPGYNHSEPILRPLHPERVDTILYSERGEVVCRCPRSAELRPMAYQGFEANRNTLKYRCPAAAYDLDCKGREACLSDSGSKAGAYGRIVRVNLEGANRRIFTPTPWGSPSWKRGYRRRSALERINARLDRVYGFEVHFIRGMAKMQTRVSLALAVMMAMAMALASIRIGQNPRMRSLVRPFEFADTG